MSGRYPRPPVFFAAAVAIATAALVGAALARHSGPAHGAGPVTPGGSGNAGTGTGTGAPSPATETPPTFAAPHDIVVVATTADGTTVVHGTYPDPSSRCVDPPPAVLDARYPGALTVGRAAGGTLSLTLSMPFERYLEGIAEVPSSWPSAALEAQAVAARSYALAQTGWTGAPGETLPNPICSTDACQVYAGLPIHPSAAAAPWIDAVRHTAGQVLLWAGRPADTMYFSTSNGHTYGNDQVFGSPPLPYLRPVPERDDGASPEAHWRATIPFSDLRRFLGAGGTWPAGRRISNVRLAGSTVTVSGHGITRSLDRSTFRSSVNTWAHCLEPGRYPGPNSSSGAPLPLTVPSGWFGLAARGGAVVLTGRGWGHGVGMVQWGAYGKAVRGLSYRRILAYYYGGLLPHHLAEPGRIRVIVASGLSSLSISASGPLTVDGRRVGATHLLVTGGGRLTVTAGPV